MKSNLTPSVLRFVQVSSAFGKRALDGLNAYRTAEKAAAAKAPALVEKMANSGAIKPEEKSAAAAMLASHEQTLALLNNAVDKIAELTSKQAKAGKQASAALGGAVSDKEAGVDASTADGSWSLKDPYVGQRSSVKKASDHALLAGLGLSH